MVTPIKRIIQVACAVVWCLFAAGPIFGFAALKPVLVAEGVYSEACQHNNGFGTLGSGPCKEQDLKLNFMFNLGAILTNVDALLVGFILDRYGPRICGLIGSVILFGATLVLSSANSLPGDPWLVGYSLLALGGPFVFISSFHLSNTFSNYSGTILALLTGAFDASSAVFLGFRVSYEKTNITLSQLFSVYLVVPLFILIANVLIMPSASYKSDESFAKQLSTSAGEMESEEAALLASEYTNYGGRRASFVSRRGSSFVHERPNLSLTAADADIDSEEVTPGNIAQYGSLEGLTAREQLCTNWSLLIIIFTTLQMLRINYFVATINSQYTYMLGHETAQQINSVFDYLLPVGGILSIPMIGYVLDHLSLVGSWTTVVTMAMCIGALNCVPRDWAAYLHIFLFVLYRPLYYTAVSDYAAKIFGFKTFGTVYGVIICISGLFNILQSVLDRMTKEMFHLNPTPVNLMLLGATFVSGASLVLYIKSQGFNLKRHFLEIEANSSRPMMMPDAVPVACTDTHTAHNIHTEENEISFNDPSPKKSKSKSQDLPKDKAGDCGKGGCDGCVCDV